MADKTTTLKTKTNDNVYPNVIGDNRKNAFVDSSTITHHFYDQTHKVGFQIANETNIKIQNSLQKPAGLTKTELVGVGANGQENIEIGDNLTLANGKLSATAGGGSGGGDFDIITISDETTYTGTITGNKPIVINYEGEGYIVPFVILMSPEGFTCMCYIETTSMTNIFNFKKDGTYTRESLCDYYYHFITITSTSGTIYLTYINSSTSEFDSMGAVTTDIRGKSLTCSGFVKKNEKRLPITYIVEQDSAIIANYYDDSGVGAVTFDNTASVTDKVMDVY